MHTSRNTVWSVEIQRKGSRTSAAGPWVTVMLFNRRQDASTHGKPYRRTHRVSVRPMTVN